MHPLPALLERARAGWLAGWLVLACCLLSAALPAAAAAGVPTDFVVHNRLPTPLYGFRVLVGDQRWAELGDLPPGESRLHVELPEDPGPGTFEFRYPDQLASGDYTLGGFRRATDGPTILEIDSSAGMLRGEPVQSGRGSVRLSAASLRGSRLAALAQDSDPRGLARTPADLRLPLSEVPAGQARASRWMVCIHLAPVGAFVDCLTLGSVGYMGAGAGLGLGFAVGYFWSPYPFSDIAPKFPLHATVVHPFVTLFITFYNLDSERSPSRRVGQFIGMGPGVGVEYTAYGGMGPGDADDPPQGSYRASCTELEYDPGSSALSGLCASASGATRRTTLVTANCMLGEVRNDDGTLQCDRPGGTYPQTCDPIRYRDGVLQAGCLRADGATRTAARLEYASDCEPGSGVVNDNGDLRCETPRLPPGPYRASCRGLSFADGVLGAEACGSGFDGVARHLRLDYARDCAQGSEVAFNVVLTVSGALVCVSPR